MYLPLCMRESAAEAAVEAPEAEQVIPGQEAAPELRGRHLGRLPELVRVPELAGLPGLEL